MVKFASAELLSGDASVVVCLCGSAGLCARSCGQREPLKITIHAFKPKIPITCMHKRCISLKSRASYCNYFPSLISPKKLECPRFP